VITITPTNPNSNTPITISVNWAGCLLDSGIQQTGTAFDIHFNLAPLCGTPPGGIWDFPIGTLPVGTYSVVRRTLDNGVPVGQESTSFSVVAAPATNIADVPTLDTYGLALTSSILMLLFAYKLRH
jgi:hypothetical protein